jgi:hypothetical protein
MTYRVDAKRRSTLPPGVKPGDSVDYEPLGPNEWKLVRLAKPARQTPPVAKRGQYCNPADFQGINLDEPAFPPLS